MSGGPLPERASAVVVGGGIVGCSTAYALAKAGWDDVVLVERDQLTSGTTWHSAGFVLHVQPTPGLVGVVRDTMAVLREIEDETGMATGFHQTGQMRLALSEDRMQGLLRQAAVARAQGTRVAHLSTEEAYERFPWFDPTGVVGAVLYPDDGRANPTDATMALAFGARQRGVQIREHTSVTRVAVTDGRVVGVETDAGPIATDVLVNCTGMWGRQVAARNSVSVPLQAMPHYYVVTTELPGFETSLSGVSVSDEHVYVGPEGKGLLVGFFEPGGKAWAPEGIPEDASFTTLAEDWDHLGRFYESATRRFPVLADAGIRLFLSGPESFTPDGFAHVGRAPGLEGYWVAAGFNSGGFLSGPGIGAYLARQITEGAPARRLLELDPRRTQPHQANVRYLSEAAEMTLGTTMSVHYPGEETAFAAGIRRRPLHLHQAAQGAVFGASGGWDVANYFTTDADAVDHPSFGRPGWLPEATREYGRLRAHAAIVDTSHAAKLLVQGPDARAVLDRASTVAPPCAGHAVDALWLNDEGGVEARVAIWRPDAAEAYLVLSDGGAPLADADWISRQARGSEIVTVTDVTAGWAILWLLGPAATDVLGGHVGPEQLPGPGVSTTVDVGLGRVHLRRARLAGEAGWCVLTTVDYAAHVYETLTGPAADDPLVPIGEYTRSLVAVENCSPAWGIDVGPQTVPGEVGLLDLVDLSRATDFVGRSALEAAGADGRRLVRLAVVDPDEMMFGGEPVYQADRVVGSIGSARHLPSLGRCAGLCVIDAEVATDPSSTSPSGLEVDLGGRRWPVERA